LQELGRSIARQLAQAGQWKYSMPQTSCPVYEWGLTGGQEALSLSAFCEFEPSFVWEFTLFQEIWDFEVL